VPATCFPTASALGSSWDPELVRRIGAALGREARAQHVAVVLGPGINIKRSPLCGRNFEYFSEDPLLSGVLGAAMIDGVQSQGAVHDRVAALAAGVDLEMPPNRGVSDAAIVAAVRSGQLDEAVLDAAVARVLRLVERATANPPPAAPPDPDEHHALARAAAAE